jgi:peptide/nickel transport system permease protein
VFSSIIKSLLQAALVMLAVAFLAFSMFRFIGDPVANMLGQEATLQDRQQVSESLGLDKPFIVQFALFAKNAATGDFGISWKQARPVKDLMAEKLPATLELAILSMIFALVFGIIGGVYTAIHKDSWLSQAIMSLSLAGVSLPTFLVGIGLIYIFAVELKGLPSFGRNGVAHKIWVKITDFARYCLGHFTAHPHHASCARRNVRNPAHRFREIRKSARRA